MNEQLIQIIAASTIEVFETMSFLDAEQNEPVGGDYTAEADYTACICLAGKISGMLAFHCSQEFASNCCSLISGDDSEPSEENLRDTVGEIANMIAGSVKRAISSKLDLIDISIPSVISGKRHHFQLNGSKETFPRWIIPFTVDDGEIFHVEILYHEQ